MGKTCNLTILVVLVTLAFITQAAAQSAYHGGKGDGFGMATTEQAMVGMEENTHHQKLTMYPQPVRISQALTVVLPSKLEKSVEYRIHNTLGTIVQKGRMNNNARLLTLDLKPKLTPGVYLLELKIGEEVWRQQMVLVNE